MNTELMQLHRRIDAAPVCAYPARIGAFRVHADLSHVFCRNDENSNWYLSDRFGTAIPETRDLRCGMDEYDFWTGCDYALNERVRVHELALRASVRLVQYFEELHGYISAAEMKSALCDGIWNALLPSTILAAHESLALAQHAAMQRCLPRLGLQQHASTISAVLEAALL